MTGEELKEKGKNRVFDQLVVVTGDIFKRMSAMMKVQKAVPGCICTCTQAEEPLFRADGTPIEYTEKRASFYYSNIEYIFVEPVSGDTLYKQYLDKYGDGICCIRERIQPDEVEAAQKRFADKGYSPAQCMKTDAAGAFWLDLTDELGFFYEVIAGGTAAEPLYRSSERLVQINVSTPHLDDTIAKLADLLEIGPWEVGRQRNAVTHDTAFTVGGELKEQEFAFKLAILVCGNMEWEVIEPEIGELVYSEYVRRKGIGFHHVLFEIPAQKWTERLDTYAADGISVNCRGGLGPVNWCYMETEKELGFYVELRTDAVMDKLPDGYVLYFYPDN